MPFELKITIIMIPVLTFLFYFSQIKKSSWSVLAYLFIISLVTFFVFYIGGKVYENYLHPQEWDFLVFWMDGKVASTGGNFYTAENYREVDLPYNPSDGFRNEIIDVGFKYPPMTMFLFFPLGFFNYSKAYLLWQMANIVISVICIYGLWRLFLKEHGVLSLLLVAALLLVLNPTIGTFYYAQTNFIALLFFLAFWGTKSKDWGGVWLALCVVVKPYMAVLYFYPLLARRWKMLAVAIITLMSLTVLSTLAFGLDVLVSFFSKPISKVPLYLYTEIVNQSLLATILRLSQDQIINGSPILNPVYLGISFVLLITTTFVAVVNRNNNDHWVILSILFLSLIIYPATLQHYSIFLILPVVLLLQQSYRGKKERIAMLFMIFITYLLSGNYAFFANLFVWFVCIAFAVIPENNKFRLFTTA